MSLRNDRYYDPPDPPRSDRGNTAGSREESRAMNTMRKAHAIKRKIVSIYGQEAIDPNVKLQGRLF
jgi:hypothetical protein